MTDEIIYYIITAFILGGGAAVTPGPLNTMVISESLKHGSREGIKIALAPLLTDAPIVIGSVLLVNQLSKIELIIYILSVIGGLFIIYLGYKELKSNPINSSISDNGLSAYKKGILTNLLSPNPYIFWITIGAPLLVSSFELSVLASISFLIIFYLLLVGFKVMVALFTQKMKRFISGKKYTVLVRILGTILIAFGVLLIQDGITNLISID